MLDLSGMKGIRVDPVRRIAEAQPGLTLGEFDHETQAFGLATTTGVVSSGCGKTRPFAVPNDLKRPERRL
jgi:FAD/FMN-containing dehydrogenase